MASSVHPSCNLSDIVANTSSLPRSLPRPASRASIYQACPTKSADFVLLRPVDGEQGATRPADEQRGAASTPGEGRRCSRGLLSGTGTCSLYFAYSQEITLRLQRVYCTNLPGCLTYTPTHCCTRYSSSVTCTPYLHVPRRSTYTLYSRQKAVSLNETVVVVSKIFDYHSSLPSAVGKRRNEVVSKYEVDLGRRWAAMLCPRGSD